MKSAVRKNWVAMNRAALPLNVDPAKEHRSWNLVRMNETEAKVPDRKSADFKKVQSTKEPASLNDAFAKMLTSGNVILSNRYPLSNLESPK
ncbi:hypothetical protein GCM10010361_64100 [Streptomyces olivaceiscleroticus]|uniref:Uncharacterized protein n=1 Tax=Streptomyces olivaceiscleroticus TaxID=68245 RepID=A0ABP3KZH2_9ACTN